MKKFLSSAIALGALCLALSGCRKEETFRIADTERNWYEITSRGNTLLDERVYDFYDKWKIPVFFNDTIGEIQCKDVWGRTYTYYEKLKLDYSMGSSGIDYEVQPVWGIVECDKNSCGIEAIDFLDNDVMPNLPQGTFIKSFYLVDTLCSYESNYAYQGYNTFVAGSMSRIATMNTSEKKQLKGMVIGCFLMDKVLNLTANRAIINNEFMKVSLEVDKLIIINGIRGYMVYDPGYCEAFFTDPMYKDAFNVPWPIDLYEDFGFLGWDPATARVTDPYGRFTPSLETDVRMFAYEALACGNDEAFYAKWPPETYERTSRKYVIIKKMLANAGYMIPATAN